jgi:HEAT repeat protein
MSDTKAQLQAKIDAYKQTRDDIFQALRSKQITQAQADADQQAAQTAIMPALVTSLYSPDPNVRVLGAIFLGKMKLPIREPATINLLLTCLDSPDQYIRHADARAALAALDTHGGTTV